MLSIKSQCVSGVLFASYFVVLLQTCNEDRILSLLGMCETASSNVERGSTGLCSVIVRLLHKTNGFCAYI